MERARDPLEVVLRALEFFPAVLTGGGIDELERRLNAADLGEYLDPEFENVTDPGVAGMGVVSSAPGVAGLVESWRNFTENFEYFEVLERRHHVLEDGRVFEFGHMLMRFPNGLEMREWAGAIYTVREGRLLRSETFRDPSAGARSVGLDPDSLPPPLDVL